MDSNTIKSIADDAIKLKRKIEIEYDGHMVICNPHKNGIRGGNTLIEAAHSGGYSLSKSLGKSTSNWRYYEYAKITKVTLLSDTFSIEQGYNANDGDRWDQIFSRI